jgi:lipoprotein-releasing system permease protein
MIFFIARRHIFSAQGFATFMSYASVIGISLGVAALIVILSVMNGFQKEIRGRILSMISHIEVVHITERQEVIDVLDRTPGVKAYAPFIMGQGLLSSRNQVRGVAIRGISSTEEVKVIPLSSYIKAGSLESFEHQEFSMIIGTGLAQNLGVSLGDRITLVTPQGQMTPAGIVPRLKVFRVLAFFESGMYEYDQNLVMIRLRDAQALFRMPGEFTGIRVRVDDPLQAPYIKLVLEKKISDGIVQSWQDLHGSYFRAVQIEKRMMWIVLGMLIAVSAFNLVSGLVMRVHQKQGDIAILRTMGASSWQMMSLFMVQGLFLGMIGLLLGILLGLLLTFNLQIILHFMEYFLGHKLFSAEIYNIDYLPTHVLWQDILHISIIVLLLSILASLYPSWRAAHVAPAQALRYE